LQTFIEACRLQNVEPDIQITHAAYIPEILY